VRIESEVVVVGAGVMGAATARALAHAGRDVLLVEQFRLGHTRGSSHGRSRIFRLSYAEVEWVRLAQEAMAGWRALEEETGERLLEPYGLLELLRTPEEGSRPGLTEAGVAFELLSPDEVRERFPVTIPDDTEAVFQADAGIVYADRAYAALVDSARRAGARVQEETPVDSLDQVEAGAIVVTAGAWAKPLLAAAGIGLPVVPTRETVGYFRLEADRPVPSVVEVVPGTSRHGVYSLADPLHGLKLGMHKSGPPTDPDDEGVADEGLAGAMSEAVARYYPQADPEPVALETCLYTIAQPDDDRFFIERHGRIVVGSPCSGHGFKFAPAVGERLAALAGEAL
jgi:sarcosine oxidase